MSELNLNRQQLSQFLPNHEAVKAFETLFTQVRETLPEGINGAQNSADYAILQTAEALSGLADVANSLAQMLYKVCNEMPTEDAYQPPLCLGSMAEQDASSVGITGGKITASLSDNTANLIASSVSLGNAAGGSVGTLTNAPSVGNPSKWLIVDDNGVSLKIPAW